MTHDQTLKNPRYKNWVRSSLGLIYLKQGLEGFVEDRIQKRHSDLLAVVRSKTVSTPSTSTSLLYCNQCTSSTILPEHALTKKGCIQSIKSKCLCRNRQGRRPCPNRVCSLLYDLIAEDHLYKNPLWLNTDPSSWCTDPWSIAKCYQSTPNSSTSVKEIDAAGLLSTIINSCYIHSGVHCLIDPPSDLFSKAREARNEILHSPVLELQDTQAAAYIDLFISVLHDKSFTQDPSVQCAIKNLQQLKNDSIYIGDKDEFQIRENALNAIEEKRLSTLAEIEEVQSDILLQVEQIEKGKASVDDFQGTVERNKERITHLSSRLFVLESSERSKRRRIEDRSDKTVCSALEEKIEEHQKDIRTHIENLEKRHEQNYQNLSEGIAELQRELKSVQVDLDNLRAVKDYHMKQIDYLKQKHGMQRDLVDLYSQFYTKTDVSPLLPEEDVDVDEVYVNLKMERIKYHRQAPERKSHAQKGQPIYFIEDVLFQGEDTAFRNVFLTADAGLGKTTLCRKMISLWTQVHSQNESVDNPTFIEPVSLKIRTKDCISQRNKHVMKRFSFLFYVSLRHTNEEGSVEEMIRSQLVSKKYFNLLDYLLENEPENCLVILDGLDEWTAPANMKKSVIVTAGLPVKEIKSFYPTLYTTRPWKMETIRPKSSEIDAEVKILGIDMIAAKELAASVTFKLNESKNTSRDVEDFMSSQDLKQLQDLESIPLLLKLLVCLWHDEQQTGKSICGIYSAVLELLLRVSIDRNGDDQNFTAQLHRFEALDKDHLPSCFDERTNCQSVSSLLYSLAEFSFKTLFDLNSKQLLVFEGNSLTKLGMSAEKLSFCLKTGLLSQRALLGKSAVNRGKSLTFLHKTFQEFFAAVHMAVRPVNETVETVRTVCDSIDKLLEMSKIFQFVGGMKPEIICTISEHAAILSDNDQRFVSYRKTDNPRRIKIMMLQDLFLACIEEAADSGIEQLPTIKLRDLHLWDENIDQNILYTDPEAVRSVSSSSRLTENVQGHVARARDLNLMFFSGLFGNFPKDLVFTLMQKSPKSLSSLGLKTGNLVESASQCFPVFQNLKKINFVDITINHSAMITLLSSSPNLVEFSAMCVYCIEDSKCGCTSQNNDDEAEDSVASMVYVESPVKSVSINYGSQALQHVDKVDNIEDMNLANLKHPHDIKNINRILPSAKKLKTLQLHGLDFKETFLNFPVSMLEFRMLHLSEICISEQAVSQIFGHICKTEVGFRLRMEDVYLISGHPDSINATAEKSEGLQVEAYKINKRIKKSVFGQTGGSSNLFSLHVSKIK